MRDDDIRYAKNGDVHLAYELHEQGGGVDLVLIRTFVSQLEQYRRLPSMVQFTERLGELGRLICFDHRGTGLSDRVRGYRLPTIEERVDDLSAVLDAAGSDRAVVVALADGGPLGCMFAAARPERTVALVLCNTRPRIAWARDYPWGMREAEFERELADIDAGWGTRAKAEADARRLGFGGMSLEELTDWYLGYMRVSAGPGDAVAAFRMFYDSDVRTMLGTIRVPTLVLSRGGEQADEGAAFARLIPGARHQAMPGTAPYVLSERADAYLEAIQRFVSEVRDDEAAFESILATVLFTDIVGSTRRQAELGDLRWQQLIAEHHRLIRGCLARYRGRELDTAGDGFFAAFDGPVRAIRCAQAIGEAVAPLGIELRAGLHTGECRNIEGKVGGLAVSIGARVTALAGPAEILVSQTVRDLVAGSGLEFLDRGEHELKGVPGTWKVYAVS
ncbi:MAG TPA: adenylate/guanylate cyclase domain-containing protein [Gaiellaceae bacterium]|nr:adenylate/guanylate cyclase domain-containing protein [Gaiellaceae bacterium]